MAWFCFHQNNSGGYFKGPAQDVYVEADTRDEADARAETLGVYFEDHGFVQDCSCCGHRWSRAHCPELPGEGPFDSEEEPASWLVNSRKSFIRDTGCPHTLILHADGRHEARGLESP